jgi:hypothetical protein
MIELSQPACHVVAPGILPGSKPGFQPQDPNDRNGNLGWFTAPLSPGNRTD